MVVRPQSNGMKALLADVRAVLTSIDLTSSARHLQNVSTALGIDRPPVWADPAFLVLLAISLSPRNAIAYELLDPYPRWKYIRDYLQAIADLDRNDLEWIARAIAQVLDAHDRQRSNVVMDFDRLMGKQNGRCAICRLPFQATSQAVLQRDPFRPLWHAPLELTRPEVDHIKPISWAGENQIENLQLLCRACNVAKADGVRISPNREAAVAVLDIDRIPRMHLFRLLVWLVGERNGQCEIGGCRDRELTIRPIHTEAPLVRSNLLLACYRCSPVSKSEVAHGNSLAQER